MISPFGTISMLHSLRPEAITAGRALGLNHPQLKIRWSAVTVRVT
jgi:hypothetical protein